MKIKAKFKAEDVQFKRDSTVFITKIDNCKNGWCERSCNRLMYRLMNDHNANWRCGWAVEPEMLDCILFIE